MLFSDSKTIQRLFLISDSKTIKGQFLGFCQNLTPSKAGSMCFKRLLCMMHFGFTNLLNENDNSNSNVFSDSKSQQLLTYSYRIKNKSYEFSHLLIQMFFPIQKHTVRLKCTVSTPTIDIHTPTLFCLHCKRRYFCLHTSSFKTI